MPATADPARAAQQAPASLRLPRPRLLLWLACALSLPTLLPLAAVLGGLLGADATLLNHLFQHVLPRVAGNSLLLVLCVAVLSATLGTSLAALVALTEFPGRRAFSWLLVLPLAMPAFVNAVAMIGLFDYSGPLAQTWRDLGGQAWPEFRGLGGLSLTLVLALYPYVYLVARGAFASQGGSALEVARSLGMTPWQAFLSTALPLARPWIAAGTLLVMMETLADFGTVAAFNYETFTSAIYKAWYALFSIDSALAIAAVLLVVVVVLLALDHRLQRRQRFHRIGRHPATRLRLRGLRAWAASATCALVLLLAFGLPVARLLYLALDASAAFDARWGELALNSLSLGLIAATSTVAAALLLAVAKREHPGPFSQAAARIASLGYGLPGALLAVGLYVPMTRLLNLLADGLGWDSLAAGGLLLLLVAYGVRFTAVAQAPVDSALARLRPSLIEAARSLGLGGPRLLLRVYLPLLRGGVFTAGLLVLVDVIKEMPITLMTRPFGWDTLATRVFEYSNEGQWAQAALPALSLVLVGLVPVLLLERRMDRAA